MSIYQHYREEEHTFIDQALSWKEAVERTYQEKLTDFLDPREQHILSSIVGTSHVDVQLKFQDNNGSTERRRAILAPFYEDVTQDSFQLTLLQATFHAKFIRLEHRDILGAFMSLGMKREKLGDVFVGDGMLQLVIAKEIAPYVLMNLTTIKNAHISLEEKSLTQIKTNEMVWEETQQIVSSLRLDVVLKEVYRISRKQAQRLIEKKQVKVNFKQVTNTAYDLFEADLLSVRGKGRSKILSINGKTRKNKQHLTTAMLK